MILEDYMIIFLIDCPPSLKPVNCNGFSIFKFTIGSFQTEFFALEGLTQLMKTIERIKVNLNP